AAILFLFLAMVHSLVLLCPRDDGAAAFAARTRRDPAYSSPIRNLRHWIGAKKPRMRATSCATDVCIRRDIDVNLAVRTGPDVRVASRFRLRIERLFLLTSHAP